ncbi:hypothetical protein EV174_001047 [Coemansia sp. RSA 2320]|nr:hypothetical protein EV174_001047 [Coemansia sp. RSA 2320]
MYDSPFHGNHSHSTPASPNTYNSTQPADNRTAYDKELASLFRATAANVTQLYKEASEIGHNAYKAGYEQCFNDIWDFLAVAQQQHPQQQPAELLLAGGIEGQQIALQRLIEFARLKRLAPPRTSHFGSVGIAVNGNGGDGLLSGQAQRQQDQQLAAQTEGGAVSIHDTVSIEPELAGQAELRELESSQKHNIVLPALRRAATGTSNAAVALCAASSPAPSIPQGSDGLRMLRGKRSFETFDIMDIEPPRRRQRKEDIEMA